MPCATGTPSRGWWLGSPLAPPGCWSTLSCCKQLGRKQPLWLGGVFPLVLSFYFEAKHCWFGGKAAAAGPPWGEAGCVPQPQATKESLGQGEMTLKRLRVMKCPDSFELLILKKKRVKK